jgi:hypothetical protein
VAVDDAERVARELYPIAVRQARGEVVLQLLVLGALATVLAVLGPPRHLAWAAVPLAAGGVATAYDIRWWLWLRQADAVEAHQRLQARSEFEGNGFRRRLTLVVSVCAILVWVILAR